MQLFSWRDVHKMSWKHYHKHFRNFNHNLSTVRYTRSVERNIHRADMYMLPSGIWSWYAINTCYFSPHISLFVLKKKLFSCEKPLFFCVPRMSDIFVLTFPNQLVHSSVSVSKWDTWVCKKCCYMYQSTILLWVMFDIILRNHDFLIKPNSHLDCRFNDSSHFILFKATERIMRIYVWGNIALN